MEIYVTAEFLPPSFFDWLIILVKQFWNKGWMNVVDNNVSVFKLLADTFERLPWIPWNIQSNRICWNYPTSSFVMKWTSPKNWWETCFWWQEVEAASAQVVADQIMRSPLGTAKRSGTDGDLCDVFDINQSEHIAQLFSSKSSPKRELYVQL